VTIFTRSDGQQRLLLFLDGPPASEPPESRCERLLAALDAVCPAWDDAIILGAVGGLLCALLAGVIG
jgi:hypothetical protein